MRTLLTINKSIRTLLDKGSSDVISNCVLNETLLKRSTFVPLPRVYSTENDTSGEICTVQPTPTKFNFSPNFPAHLEGPFSSSFLIYNNFVTQEEEDNLMLEFEKHFKRHLYEKDHWDNAIAKFRETEKKFFDKVNTPVIEKIRKISFPESGRTRLSLNELRIYLNSF